VTVGHFHIPGDATRREYAVYVMVARHRDRGEIHLYVGKTGDNREGCNPVISRAGNHFSFNKIHSQMRNKLPGEAEEFDFDFFYATFGKYVDPRETRDRIDLVNEMERQLNRLVQSRLENVLNPYRASGHVHKAKRQARDRLLTEERRGALEALVTSVVDHIAKLGPRRAGVSFDGRVES
jgi:hypothetical protein